MDMQYPTNDLLPAIIGSDAVIVVYVHIGVVNYAILTSILVTIARYIHYYLESVYSRAPHLVIGVVIILLPEGEVSKAQTVYNLTTINKILNRNYGK